MKVAERARALRMQASRPTLLGLFAVCWLAVALVPAASVSQELKVDLLRMSEMTDARYYIAEKGEVPPGYILLGDLDLRPGPLESRFDLRNLVVEYDPETGLLYRFRVPGDYYFSRKEERRELFYYLAPRDLTIPGLEVSVEPIDGRARDVETASLRSTWVEDVRYNLSLERAEKTGKGLLSLDLPISLPKPIERIIGKGEETNLTVQGSERIAISGRSDWCSNCPKTEGMVKQDKFPDLNMQQDLNVSLRGTIGEKVNVEIQHSSNGQGVESTNRVRINYRGFDDDIIKLIEMGDTDLSLSGASLVSYSGTAKGLFGVKALATAGPLDMTVIASKEEGETASGSFTSSGGQSSSGQINDYDFIQRQFFFFENPGPDFLHPRPGFGTVFPVVGGAAGDEIEVFVSLQPQEYGDPNIFKYAAKGYVDSLNNGLSDDLGARPFQAQVKQLFMEYGDFTLIQDYGGEGNTQRYVGIELASPLDETRALFVRYRARNSATQQEFLVGDYKRFPTGDADSLVAEVLCLPKSATSGERATDPTWNLMMRNVYSLGSSQIDAKSLRVRIEDMNSANQNNANIEPTSSLSYIRIFGLDQYNNNTGVKGKDDLIDNVPGIIDYDRGYLMFPWYEPFNPPEVIVRSFLADTATDARERNFDYGVLKLTPDFYDQALTDQVKTNSHQYVIVVEASNGQRVFQLAAYDIIEGSEVVTVDGVKLSRGTDYDIDYTDGTVTLKTSILPDSKVNIDYQHKPLVGGGKNTLLGFGANLNLSQNSRINGTFLYSSQGSPKYTPRLGEEPARMMAADINGAFIFYPSWMTSLANLLPRVDTNDRSTLNLGGEIAMSFPNPNVKGEAIVDDMEGIEEASQVSLLRRSWYPSSPAFDVEGDGSIVRRGPEDEPKFYWYNAARTAKQEYFITSRRDLNPGLDERENSTVTTLFLDPIKPQAGQWCGVMTGFPGGGLDLSTAQYLEIWVNDFTFDPADSTPRHGTVHIDFGRIDEDFYQPDLNVFDDEDQPPYGWTIFEDTGFNGETTAYPTDFSEANWITSDFTYRGINSRKGNQMHDSEDLNGSGYLDETNSYYTVSFNLADSADIDIQRDFPKGRYATYWNDPDKKLNPRKAWRKYRIDLAKIRTVFAEPRLDAIQHMRIRIDGLDSLQQFNDARLIEFAELQFVGNRWEFNGVRDTTGALNPDGEALGQKLVIGAINNKDDASLYEPPYNVQQEEGIQNKEGSIRFSFENFGPKTAFRAVKRFGQGQNYQQYRDMQFFVRPNYAVEDLDFYMQIAYDSTNYYEIEVPLDSLDRREWIWVNVNLSDLTNLKVEREGNVVTRRIQDSADPTRFYNGTISGNPTLFNVRFLYAGLRNRTGRTIPLGEVWFDDLRLGGVRRDVDHAEGLRMAADFAGVLQINSNYTRTGPEFRSLRQTRGSGVTSSNLNLSAKTNIESLVPTGRFNLPVTVQYNSTEARPKYLLNSDVEISDPAVRDSLKNVSKTYGFSVSASRRGSSNYIMKNVFDNLKTSYSYSKRDNVTPTRRDTTRTMSGSLNYQIQFRKNRQIQLFHGIKWRYCLSSFTYETGVNRQTKEEYVLSGDTMFVRRPYFYSASWQNGVNTLYEPFESVKINFSLSEQRDLGYDHEFHGLPIGIETTFGHNLSLNYQPGAGIPILSQFNPRFDFRSRYAEDLNPNKRQVRGSYYRDVQTCDSSGCATTQEKVIVYDPFGTRYLNNQRQMTFAFIVDAGRYIMRLGELAKLVKREETSVPRAQSFAGRHPAAMNAADRAREWQEAQRTKSTVTPGKVTALEEEPPPPASGAGAAPTVPPGEPEQEAPAAGPGGLALTRARTRGTAAAADTAAAARADTAAARAREAAARARIDTSAVARADTSAARAREAAARARIDTSTVARADTSAAARADTAAARAREAAARARIDTSAVARADTSGAGAVEAAAGPKPDPLMPVRKLIRFLGSVEPVNANITMDHRSSYERIYDRADLWYQFGLSDNTGVPGSSDSLEASTPLRASNNVSIDLRSSVGLTSNIGVEVKGRFDLTRDDFSGKRTETRRVTWPTLTLDWKGMERYRWLRDYMKQSTLVVGFERKTNETQSGLEKSYALSPSWNLEWKNSLSSNLSVTYSRRTQEKQKQQLWDQAWGVALALRYNIEGSKGFGVPLPFLNKRKVSFKSTLTTNLNLAYNSFSTQIDPASGVLSVSPSVQYRFSNNVTGGATVDYKRTSGGRLGQLRQSVDVQLNAEFKF
jgi:hypothetical protein